MESLGDVYRDALKEMFPDSEHLTEAAEFMLVATENSPSIGEEDFFAQAKEDAKTLAHILYPEGKHE
jgi:hypothetical protein